MENLTYSKGNRQENRTRAGDNVTRYQRVKPDPSLELAFDPDVAADKAYVVLFSDDEGDRAFDIQVVADGTTGVHISGLASIGEGRLVIAHDTGVATMNVTLRPVGTAWATTAVTT